MSTVISVRLSEEDYRLVASRAVKQGQSVPEYVKYILLRKHARNQAPEAIEGKLEGTSGPTMGETTPPGG